LKSHILYIRIKGLAKSLWRSLPIRLVSIIVPAIGVIAASLALLPRISVTVGDPEDPLNALSAAFTITNTNFVPLHEVTPYVGFGYISSGPPPCDKILQSPFDSQLHLTEWGVHDLDMDERFTITLADMFKVSPKTIPVSCADIVISVHYKPWLWPFSREKLFRFATHVQSNGHVYWYSQPLN
jgi:hypothetical protein